jgi:hypothetical protein
MVFDRILGNKLLKAKTLSSLEDGFIFDRRFSVFGRKWGVFDRISSNILPEAKQHYLRSNFGHLRSKMLSSIESYVIFDRRQCPVHTLNFNVLNSTLTHTIMHTHTHSPRLTHDPTWPQTHGSGSGQARPGWSGLWPCSTVQFLDWFDVGRLAGVWPAFRPRFWRLKPIQTTHNKS